MANPVLPRCFEIGSFDPAVFETEESFHDLAKLHFDSARSLFLRDRALHTFSLLYCMRDPGSGVAGPIIYTLSMRDAPCSRENAARLAWATKTTAKLGNAVCAVMVSEVYVVRAQSADEGKRIRAQGKSLAEHPKKEAGVFVQVEHRKWFTGGYAQGEPGGGLAPWIITSHDRTAARGTVPIMGWVLVMDAEVKTL